MLFCFRDDACDFNREAPCSKFGRYVVTAVDHDRYQFHYYIPVTAVDHGRYQFHYLYYIPVTAVDHGRYQFHYYIPLTSVDHDRTNIIFIYL